MSVAQFETKMKSFTRLFNGDPEGFRQALSPIHVTWHTRRGVVLGRRFQPVGFLTFHDIVIRAYGKVLASVGERLPGPPWGPGYPASIDALADPVDFSRQIEQWHNGVHMSRPELMNPATNIFVPRFWQLHGFIEGRFLEWQKKHRKIAPRERTVV